MSPMKFSSSEAMLSMGRGDPVTLSAHSADGRPAPGLSQTCGVPGPGGSCFGGDAQAAGTGPTRLVPNCFPKWLQTTSPRWDFSSLADLTERHIVKNRLPMSEGQQSRERLSINVLCQQGVPLGAASELGLGPPIQPSASSERVCLPKTGRKHPAPSRMAIRRWLKKKIPFCFSKLSKYYFHS